MKEFFLAYRNTLRNKRRSTITLMSIVVGVVALVLFDGFIEYTLWGLRETTINSGLGHLQVTTDERYYVSGSYDPFSFMIEDAASLAKEIEALAGVSKVVSQVKFTGTMSYEGRSGIVRVDAAPADRRNEIYSFVSVVKGRNLAAKDIYSVVLGQGVAQKLGVDIKEFVTLLSVTENGGVNASDFEVVGIASMGSRELDNVAVFMSMAGAQDFLFIDSAPLLTVLLENTNLTESTRQQLVGKLDEVAPGDYVIKRWDELADYYQQAKQLYDNMLVVTRIIILFIVAFAILNTMTMAILERTREIATLRAIGTRKRQIVYLFLWEGGLLGLIGGIFGVALAFLIAWGINNFLGGIYIPPPPGRSSGYYALFTPTLPFSSSIIVLSVMVALAGSFFPAYRAARLGIATALRHT